MAQYPDVSSTRLSRRAVLRGGAALGAAGVLGAALPSGRALAHEERARPAVPAFPVEPGAGTWKTWVLGSGSQLRPAAPPDDSTTSAELEQLHELAGQRDAAALDLIALWDTGGPAYPWNDLASAEALKRNLNIHFGARAFSLMNVAIYDATIAVWDAKYVYNRPRPSELDASLQTVLPNPASPSYPSEYAAAAAASDVLAYLFPEQAQLFADHEAAAGRSRLVAGVEYPSDVAAGRELGHAVAALVIERARADGTDAVWSGTVPTEPGHWNGTNPILPLAGTWKTWALASGSELRPGPPPAYDSAQEAAELAEIQNFPRTPKSDSDAFFWQYAVGASRGALYWNQHTSRKVLEYGLDANSPRAARAFALQSIATYDAGVACWDAKYAYWALRPFMADPNLKTLFPTPNHPSYPAAHSSFSGASCAALAALFPRDAATFHALAEQAGESRIWAGIHFRSDVSAGLALGLAVAQTVIERAQLDGAQ